MASAPSVHWHGTKHFIPDPQHCFARLLGDQACGRCVPIGRCAIQISVDQGGFVLPSLSHEFRDWLERSPTILQPFVHCSELSRAQHDVHGNGSPHLCQSSSSLGASGQLVDLADPDVLI